LRLKEVVIKRITVIKFGFGVDNRFGNGGNGVQRKFTKTLVGFKDVSYPARLKALKLLILQQRRLTADFILTHKIMFGYTDCNTDDYFLLKNQNSIVTCGNQFKTSGSAIAEGPRDALVSIEKLAIDERP